jgi:hypothetical protein
MANGPCPSPLSPLQMQQVLLRLGLVRTCSGVLGDICRGVKDKARARRLLKDYRAGHRTLAAAWTMVGALACLAGIFAGGCVPASGVVPAGQSR